MLSCSRAKLAASLLAVAAGANPHARLGPYQPVSNVIEHAQSVLDVRDIGAELGEGHFEHAKEIYTGGKHSCKSPTKTRTVQGFVSAATTEQKLQDKVFYQGFTDLGLAPGFWDELITSAFDGTGDFQGASDLARKTAIKKSLLGALTMYSAYELEAAIAKAEEPEKREDAVAPHAWDEGWAFYYGPVQKTMGKYSPWEFSWKRDLDFAYKNNERVEGAVEVSELIDDYFKAGLKAVRTATYNATEAAAARDNIYRLLAVSSIRAALKYAYKATHNKEGAASYSDEYHVEGYTYFLAAAGIVEKASPGTGAQVLGMLALNKTSAELGPGLYCDVKKALVPAYGPLGVDCALVGEWKDLPESMSCEDVPSCPSGATLPAGAAGYLPEDASTAAGEDVACDPAAHEHGEDGEHGDESSSSGAAPAAAFSGGLAAALLLLARA